MTAHGACVGCICAIAVARVCGGGCMHAHVWGDCPGRVCRLFGAGAARQLVYDLLLHVQQLPEVRQGGGGVVYTRMRRDSCLFSVTFDTHAVLSG